MLEPIFLHPWVWIVPIILAALIALIIFDAVTEALDYVGVLFGSILALITAGLYFGLMLPPYDVSFHQTYRITGEVTQVESAFSGDEGTMSQVFIASVEGIDYYIKSDDQRFRTINVGDDVNLVCGKKFAYFQEPWFDCSIGGTTTHKENK